MGIGSSVDGLTGHTGSPGSVAALSQNGLVPYDIVIFNDTASHDSYSALKGTLMHELGHALSIGWADDKGPGHVLEYYSGQDCIEQGVSTPVLDIGIDVGGGSDESPEFVSLSPETEIWSIMSRTDDEARFDRGRLVFSIEEIRTIDYIFIPSIDEIPNKDD